MTNKDIYGVLINDAHIDVSKSLKGAKQYATRNGYNIVTVRYNCGYTATVVAKRLNGKWLNH